MEPTVDATIPAGHGAFSVQLQLEEAHFSAPVSHTLLQSALQAGITLETSCRNGTCRTCMRRLASGQVSYRIEWPGLSAEEKREGYILPCVAYPASDLVVE